MSSAVDLEPDTRCVDCRTVFSWKAEEPWGATCLDWLHGEYLCSYCGELRKLQEARRR